MQVKFKNGEIRGCTTPTEQKIFSNNEGVGWLLSFSIKGAATSNNIDDILFVDNISELTFLDESGEEIFIVNNYNKITSVFVRHSEEVADTRVDIQIRKNITTE